MTPPSIAKKDLPAIREHLLSMVAEGRAAEAVEMVIELLGTLRDKNTELELKVHKLLRTQFGRRSEKIGAEQLSLLLGLLGEESDEHDADTADTEDGSGDEATDEMVESSEPTHKKKTAKRRGRQKLPEHLERREEIIRVPDEDRPCPRCDDHPERVCIGYERSETLGFEPARFYVMVHAREKLACEKCETRSPTRQAVVEICNT